MSTQYFSNRSSSGGGGRAGANVLPLSLRVSPCYLADALLFDALHRKDVLSGGRELHVRLNPTAGSRQGEGETLAPHGRCAFPLGAFCARLVVFQLYPNPSVFFPPPPSPSPSRSFTLLAFAHTHSSVLATTSSSSSSRIHTYRDIFTVVRLCELLLLSPLLSSLLQ